MVFKCATEVFECLCAWELCVIVNMEIVGVWDAEHLGFADIELHVMLGEELVYCDDESG